MALKKSEKKMLIFLGVVIVAAAVYQFIIYPASQEKEPAGPARPARQAGASTAAVPAPPAVQRQSAVNRMYTTWKRDPFYAGPRPLPAAAAKRTGAVKPAAPQITPPVLNGILTHDTGMQAIIDNTVFSEGEEKNGIHVISIERTKVVCTKQNRTFTLHWSESQ